MVCIIPARGGSKRLPGKNIKELGGVSVLGWVIDAAYRSSLFDSIIVSTDDGEVVDVAVKHGATVHNRPAELCKDDVPDTAVIQYYMDELQPDYLCYLYPTAALTTPEQLIRGLDACRAIGGRVGCRVKYNQLVDLLYDGKPWHTNKTCDVGQFYWIRGGDPTEDRGYIELDPMECQDVNTAEDWAMLEAKWMIQNSRR